MAPLPAVLHVVLLLLVILVSAEDKSRNSNCQRVFKNPIPAGARCGQYGSITSPSLIGQAAWTLEPLNNCRDSCMDKSECQAFSYDSNSKLCKIYAKGLTAMNYRTASASGGVRYWERTCAASQPCETLVTTTLTAWGRNYDVEYFPIDLPFPIWMFGRSATRVYMSVNGVLSFSPPTNSLDNNAALPASTLPDISICAYWDDLAVRISTGTQQEMSWAYDVNPSPRIVTFRWNSDLYSSGEGIDVTLEFSERDGVRYPAIRFADTSGGGSSATIGSQCLSCGQFSQFFETVEPGDDITLLGGSWTR